MSRSTGVVRIGRMARWQRRSTYALFGICFVSGIVWFTLLDVQGLQPPQVVVWWIVHGVSSFVALLAIGAALPQHVVATWRHRRNRLAGTTSFALLGAAAVSALLLLYGPEPSHAVAHWVHVGAGLAVTVAFVWHIVRGRRSTSSVDAATHARAASVPSEPGSTAASG